jgi:hypothetical protein
MKSTLASDGANAGPGGKTTICVVTVGALGQIVLSCSTARGRASPRANPKKSGKKPREDGSPRYG